MKRRYSSSSSLPHMMSLRTFSRQEKCLCETKPKKNQEIFFRQDLSRRNLYSYCSNICSLCLNCKTKTNKKFADIKKKFVDFQNFQKSNFVRGKYLKIRSLINLSLGHASFHEKFGPNRFSCFDVYWIQTDRQAKYKYRLQKDSFLGHTAYLKLLICNILYNDILVEIYDLVQNNKNVDF